MFLKGEMAQSCRDYAAIAGPLLTSSSIPYYLKRVESGLSQSPPLKRFAPLRAIIQKIVDGVLLKKLETNLTAEERNALDLFDQAVGLPQGSSARVLLIPDLAQNLSQIVFAQAKANWGFYRLPPQLGCTSFAAAGEDGQIFGRNLDYEGGGYYDQNQALILHHPTNPQGLKSISITSLGSPLGAITALNEAGLFITLHQLNLSQSRLFGRPILLLVQELIRNARTLKQAIDIVRSHPLTSPWRLLVHSHHENKSSVFDVSARYKVVKDFQEYKNVITNTAWAPELARDQYSPSYSYLEDSAQRWRYLTTALQASGRISIQQAVDWISSHEYLDLDGNMLSRREAVNIIARRNNVQSLVFSPSQSSLYLAHTPLRFARPLDGLYQKIHVSFEKESFLNGFQSESYRSKWAQDAHRVRAKALFREAGELVGERGDYPRALELVKEAQRLDPLDPHYPMFFVVISLLKSAWTNSRLEETELKNWEMHLRQSEKLESLPRYQMIHRLFLARILDLQGRRPEALQTLESIDVSFYDRLREAVKKQKTKTYSLKQAQNILIEFSTGDFFWL